MRFVDIAGLVKGASKVKDWVTNFWRISVRLMPLHRSYVALKMEISLMSRAVSILCVTLRSSIQSCAWQIWNRLKKRQERLVKLLKTGDKKVPIEKAVLDKVLAGLSEAVPARRLGLTEDELEFLKELHLLTMKPVLYVANVSEEEVADASANPHVQAVVKYAAGEGAEVITVSAKMESEIAELPDEEAQEFFGDGRIRRSRVLTA